MDAETITITLILGAPIMFFLLWIVIDVYKENNETKIIKYYTINHENGMYTITLWVAEVYVWKNKCKKKPVEVERRISPYKHDIDDRESKYTRNGIYDMRYTYGAEKCLL